MSVSGKVIIVTGVASGIGLGVTQHLLEHGAKVLGVDISPRPGALGEDTESFVFHQSDLTAAGAAEAVVELAKAGFGGRVDGLANVAGVMDNMASVDLMDDTIYERVMAVNVTAPLRLMRAVIGTMRSQRAGSIVNVSSKSGRSGATAGVAYTASKHALLGATKNVAWRFKKEGVRCNAIMPGAVRTAIYNLPQPLDMEGMQCYSDVQKLQTDVGPAIEPEELGPLVAFLMSDGSRFINGAEIAIDQAWSTI